MQRLKAQIIAGVLIAGLTVSGGPAIVSAGTVSEFLPAAGAARVLNEGKSATVIRAEKIKATGKVDATDVATVTTAAMEATEKASDTGVITIAAVEDDEPVIETDTETSTETPSAGAGDYAVETDGDQSHKSSSRTASSEKEESKDNTVSSDDLSVLSAGAGNEEVSSSEDDDEMDLVKAVTEAESNETEDFSNLVVANVTDFVYVRTEPSEDAEVAGKLYKDSVGEALEEADNGWIKIKSGNTEGYVSLEFVFTGEQAVSKAKEVGRRSAKVITTTLYVRQKPGTDADVVGLVPMDDILTVEEETNDDWIKVSIEEGDGYVSTDYVKVYTEFVHAESKAEEEARLKKEEEERRAAARAAEEAAARNRKKNGNGNKKNGAGGGGKTGGRGGASYSVSGSGNGSSVANYALQFVGNPYVYGGSSLTNGTDCSGFVMSVYRNFGVSLPHSSGGDRGVGYAVSGGLANAQAGDIVCYSGHVGIYIGGGQIVHASTAKTGIKVSNANYRTPVAVRRIF
ncbi:MAG: SH3 domain-containing protein [Lachnospiraceae bacterium]|nr:SH3 domain-containing protein [Lachnospiraceae bacterium]